MSSRRTPLTATVPTTVIRLSDLPLTTINFLHVEDADQARLVDLTVAAAEQMASTDGNVSLNVLRSLDGSRVVTYGQWLQAQSLHAAERTERVAGLIEQARALTINQARPRWYTVVYTDDRSPDGVSVISPSYAGAIFINEITTQPSTQRRLLELVIANNEIQSQNTPGYRSANFHRSTDGERAVNYSLWDTPEHCIQAISAMADMDENLAETVEIANPDFRFYELVHATHA